MKKVLFSIILALVSLYCGAKDTFAQNSSYVISSFSSQITINQDASVTVKETIIAQFREPKHGIFRSIPVIYRTKDQVINSRFELIGITGSGGDKYKYSKSRDGDYVVLKIGNPNSYVTGTLTYNIEYRMRNIIQRFEDHDELYWNVAGDAWDTDIIASKATLITNFAKIKDLQCFSGVVGSVESKCDFSKTSDNSAEFISNSQLGLGRDMTIVVGLDKSNQLTFSQSTSDYIHDYWPYPVVVLPIIIMLYVWFKYGRDIKYKGDNIYYTPDDKSTETVPIFSRKFLPLVYAPINGLTPSEVGTLVDERVDIQDVVAEIVELARLGYVKIEKIDKKWAKDDYLFRKLKKDTKNLEEYQKYLLEELFKHGEIDNIVKLSELKSKFYKSLGKFREKLYDRTTSDDLFVGNPDKVRIKWLILVSILACIAFSASMIAMDLNADWLPLAIFVLTVPFAFLFAWRMPKRTPKGYALFRQIKGLAWYLNKGKWRTEIQEKHLFFEEMLPLAISLGVAKKLANDMQDLGIKPPSYFNVGSAVWVNSFTSFNSMAASNLVAGAKSSGGWSGGSGFSGGVGGGFGGGGGGSW